MAEKCIGCDSEVETKDLEIFVVMHEIDFLKLEKSPSILGKGRFHAAPVCTACHRDPGDPKDRTKAGHRKRTLKGHFFYTHQLEKALGLAGSSSSIGG